MDTEEAAPVAAEAAPTPSIRRNVCIAAVASLPPPHVKALCFLAVDHPVRATCIQIYTDTRFANFILLIIVLNSILMLITYSAPCDTKHPCLQDVAKWIDLVFTTIFQIEMTIKVIVLGFALHTQAYLRNGWNVLDFITCMAALVSLSGVLSNVNILRLLRILRPLRTMSRVEGLRNLMGALFAAVPEIRDNVILIIFLVVVFAILGTHLFAGALHKRCYIVDPQLVTVPTLLPTTAGKMCGGSFSCTSRKYIEPYLLPEQVACEAHLDIVSEGPLSFDHLGVSALLVFKIFSGDDWPEDMINTMNAVSAHAWFYFFMCVMVGGLFATNLFLAVLINAYYTNAKRADEDSEDKKARATAAWFRLIPERKARAGSVASGLQVMVKSMPASMMPVSGMTSPAAGPGDRNSGEIEERRFSKQSTTSVNSRSSNPPNSTNGVQGSHRYLKATGVTSISEGDEQPNASQTEIEIDRRPSKVGFTEESPRQSSNSKPDSPDNADAHSQNLTVPNEVLALPVSRSNSDVGTAKKLKRLSALQIPSQQEESQLDYIRRRTRELVLHTWVVRFVLCITFLNVVALAIDHHDIDVHLLKTLDTIGIVCTCIFALEISLKLFSMGPVNCLSDKYNAFDALLVLMGIPDLVGGGSSAFSAFRAFKMMRAVRILRRWPSIHNLLKALIGCLTEGVYVALLLLLQIFIFSILGMQLFEQEFDKAERTNFDSMWEAALTCFVVITGDTWVLVMKEGMRSIGSGACLYFLLLFLVGNYVLVNVVVAVILDKLDDDIANDDQDAVQMVIENDDFKGGKLADKLNIKLDGSTDTGYNEGLQDELKSAPDEEAAPGRKRANTAHTWLDNELTKPQDYEVSIASACCHIHNLELKGKSLGIFSPENPLRKVLSKLVFSSGFDLAIAMAIAVNIVFLALESPNNGDKLAAVLSASNYAFTALFFLEMVIKVVVLGLWFPGPPYCDRQALPYLRDPWNRVDAVVVLLAVSGLVYHPLSAFRSLRTLRLVIRSAELRLVIAAMLSTLPNVTQGLVVCGFIWFVFGIFGTQLFKGTFFECNDPDIQFQVDCVGEFVANVSIPLGYVNETAPRRWIRYTDHFDNVFASMYTLFAVAVGEGWGAIMYRGIDATSVGEGPSRNNNPLAALFFVIFHVVGNFFCVNLIVGIMINNFTEKRKEMSVTSGLTERQINYVETEKQLMGSFIKMKPLPPKQNGRLHLYLIITHVGFEQFITASIIANMIILASFWYNQGEDWDRGQEIGNHICTAIFGLEAAMKIAAMYPVDYFTDRWNRFDFTVVIISIAGYFLPASASGLSVVRVLRVGRLFRLVHAAKGLQKLFNTMFEGQNLAYFANIGILCLAAFFMFGVAGVNMFGTIELDNNLNFETVPNAMLTLFSISTTEGWLGVRDGLTNTDNCGGPGENDCGSDLAHIYMLSFMVVGSFMMLNLFAAVVVELFEAQEQQEKRLSEIEVIYDLKRNWAKCFGRRRFLAVKEFAEAVVNVDSGFFPTRLRRVPRLTRPEDLPDDDFVTCIVLDKQPTSDMVMAYFTALGTPITMSASGEAGVTYKDVIHTATAAIFCLQSSDVKEIRQAGYYIPEPTTTVGIWVAAMILLRRFDEIVPIRSNTAPSVADSQQNQEQPADEY